jgi:AcrR family transcriptional regulator
MATEIDRPLRKDAERNRARILEAARELFALRGLSVTLNDIAHHAGVGVGTVYRRFPDKSQLISALFDLQIDRAVALAEAALRDPDPWHGLARFLEGTAHMHSRDRGVKELMLGAPDAPELVARMRSRMVPLASELMRRAHESGQLRADVSPQDIPVIQLMIGTVIDSARHVEPELWRRYLEIILAGIHADPQPLEALATGPLSFEQIPAVMAASQPPRR